MIKDIIEQNNCVKGNEHTLSLLKRDFAQCFTSDGRFDLDVFASLVRETVPTAKEGYSLQFLGRQYANLIAATETTTVIVPDEVHNSLPENANSENIYISGDNLDALKHLLKSYAGAVKCIYIDPPYNTGSDGFVYNDKFNYSTNDLQARLGISEEDAARILDMTTRGSASHSAWLTFMFPRLLLARDLLREDGVIFISIDDNEQANLKLLCDYVFGEENLIAQFVIKSNPKGRQSDTFCAGVHDYVLAYAKDRFLTEWEGAQLTEVQKAEYKYDDGDGRKYRLLGLRQRGVASLKEDRPEMFFPIYVNPTNKKISFEKQDGWFEVIPKKSDGRLGRWMWGKAKCIQDYDRLVARWVKKRNEYDVDVKDYLFSEEQERTTKVKTIWDSNSYSNEVGTRETTAILGADVASYPKSSILIKDLLRSVLKDGDIVCDFFAGSGTTGHSVAQLITEKQFSSLMFILVQLPEDLIDRKKSLSGEELKRIERLIVYLNDFKYPLTLDYLAYEKLRRITGFKHYTLAEPSSQTFEKLEVFDKDYDFGMDILEEFGRDTVLRTWLVRDGYGFNAVADPINLNGYEAYLCGRHIYFINPDLNEDHVVALVDLYNSDKSFKPENVVIFGYSFGYTQTEALKKNLLPLRDGIKNLKVNIDIRY